MLPTIRYSLCIEEEDNVFVLHVIGECVVPTAKLCMNHSFAESLPEGHATFVRDLRLLDAEGIAIVLGGGGQDDWAVTRPDAPLPWHWSYNVLLSHESYLSASMRDETPHRTGQYAFWTTWAVFIYPDENDTFTVDIPGDSLVTTPWQEDDLVPRRYYVQDVRALTHGFLIFNDHETHEWQEAGSTVRLTIQGKWIDKTDTLVSSVAHLLQAIQKIFGGVPRSPALIAVETIPGDVLRGGVIGSSVSICMPFLAHHTEKYRDIWGGFVLHELLHLWIGGSTMRLEENGLPCYWFIEGFTCYYQDVIAARLGWISGKKYRENCEWSWQQYRSQAGMVSLHDASQDKDRYRALLYDGGRVFALILQQKVQEHTGGAANLDTVMAAMLERFGKTDAPPPLRVLIETVAAIIGAPQSEIQQWFDARLRNTNAITEADFRNAVSV